MQKHKTLDLIGEENIKEWNSRMKYSKESELRKDSELEAPRGRKKESLMQKPRGYPAVPECFALTYFGISVSVFVSAVLWAGHHIWVRI